MLFPTQEWFDEWVRVANADTRFRRAGEGWTGSVGLVVRGARGVPARDFFVRLNGADGKWTEVSAGGDPALVNGGDFVLSANLDTWQGLVAQEIDPVRAVITGQVRVRGQLSALPAWTAALRVMTELAGGLDTAFDSTAPQ